MPAGGVLNEAFDEMVSRVTASGVRVFTDPRNVAPPGVLVEPPSLTIRGSHYVELRFPLICICPPPSNLDALRVLLELADNVTAQVDNVTEGNPTTWGDKDLPAYILTASLALTR